MCGFRIQGSGFRVTELHTRMHKRFMQDFRSERLWVKSKMACRATDLNS